MEKLTYTVGKVTKGTVTFWASWSSVRNASLEKEGYVIEAIAFANLTDRNQARQIVEHREGVEI